MGCQRVYSGGPGTAGAQQQLSGIIRFPNVQGFFTFLRSPYGILRLQKTETVKPADAAEISADKPTAALVTHCPRRTRMNTGGCPERLPRCVWFVTEASWPRFPGSRLLFYFRVHSLTGRLEAMGN